MLKPKNRNLFNRRFFKKFLIYDNVEVECFCTIHAGSATATGIMQEELVGVFSIGPKQFKDIFN